MILPFLAKIVGPKLAKPVAIGGAVLLLILVLGVAKCSYDASIIKADRAESRAEALDAARKAEQTADANEATRQEQFNASQNDLRNATDPAEYLRRLHQQQQNGKHPAPAR